jgi:hypothetical protein
VALEPLQKKLEHEYAVTAWALCVMEDVRQDVQQQFNDGHGKYRDAIKRVVSRLHELPCANTHPDVPKMSKADIIDTFWDEFKAFCNKTEPIHQPAHGQLLMCSMEGLIFGMRSILFHTQRFWVMMLVGLHPYCVG